MNRRLSYLVLFAVCLAFFVVTLGAYTRLTNAGLGCPDWPGCYGHMVVAKHTTDEPIKAWTEMIHRYFAGSLGLLILIFAIKGISARIKSDPFPTLIPLLLLGLVFFQAALGMWTVTLKLLPVVVMGHLLGGLSILSALWWLWLSIKKSETISADLRWLKPWALLGLVIVGCQIALGGWVSANYAGVSCIGFPSCNNQLVPTLHFKEAFNVLSPVGANYQGGLLDASARMTIQFVHRIGAFITLFYVLGLALLLFRQRHARLTKIAWAMCVVVLLQFSLGIMNVIYLLPLKVAVGHNAVAALLLITLLTLVNTVWCKEAKG